MKRFEWGFERRIRMRGFNEEVSMECLAGDFEWDVLLGFLVRCFRREFEWNIFGGEI